MKVIIADDHKVVREGLRWMLEGASDIEIVGEAEDGQSLLDLLDTREADIVLLDIRMPGMGGLEALETMAQRTPEVRVIILTMHDEPAFVRRAIELGAAGYLLKNAGREDLVQAINDVSAGRAYIQRDLAGALFDTLSGRDRAGTTLSPREEEILRLVANGFENKQIATELGISEATVKSHLKSVFGRLEVTSRSEAVAVALRLGLIE